MSTTPTPERVYPFSSGTEYGAWIEGNCARCPKSDACDLQDALSAAYMGDGTISQGIASRLGYSEDLSATLGWSCNERLAPAAPATSGETGAVG